MPTPSVILPKPLIMIQPGDSYQGGTSVNTPINFGNIVLVYDTCDLYEVGENVAYLIDGQTTMYYGSTQYAIIEENKILANEGSTPP
jgi:hypothetical protein